MITPILTTKVKSLRKRHKKYSRIQFAPSLGLQWGMAIPCIDLGRVRECGFWCPFFVIGFEKETHCGRMRAMQHMPGRKINTGTGKEAYTYLDGKG